MTLHSVLIKSNKQIVLNSFENDILRKDKAEPVNTVHLTFLSASRLETQCKNIHKGLSLVFRALVYFQLYLKDIC
jgi:hypothetical protein